MPGRAHESAGELESNATKSDSVLSAALSPDTRSRIGCCRRIWPMRPADSNMSMCVSMTRWSGFFTAVLSGTERRRPASVSAELMVQMTLIAKAHGITSSHWIGRLHHENRGCRVLAGNLRAGHWTLQPVRPRCERLPAAMGHVAVVQPRADRCGSGMADGVSLFPRDL